MPVVIRRMLLLTFSFFLVFAPALFAQDWSAGETRNIVPMVVQWGIGGAMFIVWFYQFKKSKSEGETTVKILVDHLAESNKTTALAFDKYDRHIETMLQIQRDSQARTEQQQKDSVEHISLLVGTLARLEGKLAQPVMCPLLERRSQPREEGRG